MRVFICIFLLVLAATAFPGGDGVPSGTEEELAGYLLFGLVLAFIQDVVEIFRSGK